MSDLSPEAAFGRYQALDDDGKRQLEQLVSSGLTPRKAISLMHSQDVEVALRDAAALAGNETPGPDASKPTAVSGSILGRLVPGEDPGASTGQRVAAGGLAFADRISNNAASGVEKLTKDVGPAAASIIAMQPLFGPLAVSAEGLRASGDPSSTAGKLAAIAPGAAGVGNLAGDTVNAALMAKGGVDLSRTLAPLLKGRPAVVDAATTDEAPPNEPPDDGGAIGAIVDKVRGAPKIVKLVAKGIPYVGDKAFKLADALHELGFTGAKAEEAATPIASYGQGGPLARALGPLVGKYAASDAPSASSAVPDISEVVSPVPDSAGAPPSLLEPKVKTPDWHASPAQLVAGDLPPEAEADLARLANVSGKATTPLPKTGSMRALGKPASLRQAGADVVATEHPEDFAASDPAALKAKLAALQDLQPSPSPADMPVDVAAGGVASPARQVFQGDVNTMVNQVRALPPDQRVNAIKSIAHLFNKKTAANVARRANVSLALDPL